MRKAILLALFVLFTSTLVAQYEESKTQDKQSLDFKSIQQEDLQPVFVVVIDTVEHRIKNFRKSDFDPDWIHSIEVLKDDASNERYTSKYGVVKMRIKKAFGRDALCLIEKNRSE